MSIKIRSTTSFGREVKPSVPCRRFTACKRKLRVWIEMLRKPNCLHFSSKSPDCLPDGSGVHIRIDRTLSAASWPVTNCHECAWLSNLEKRRQEEAQAHTGLLRQELLLLLFTMSVHDSVQRRKKYQFATWNRMNVIRRTGEFPIGCL
jgi:hypothetical protein